MAEMSPVYINVCCVFKNQSHIDALRKFLEKITPLVERHCDLEEQNDLQRLFDYAISGLVADTRDTTEGNAINAVENI